MPRAPLPRYRALARWVGLVLGLWLLCGWTGLAQASVFAPMCDEEGTTVPVAAPASPVESGEIQPWECNQPGEDDGTDWVSRLPVERSELGAFGGVYLGMPMTGIRFGAGKAVRLPGGWGESLSRPGYGSGVFRPPRS